MHRALQRQLGGLSQLSLQAQVFLQSQPRAHGGPLETYHAAAAYTASPGSWIWKEACARLITLVTNAWSTSKDTSHAAQSPGSCVVCVDLQSSGEKVWAVSDSPGVL